MIVTRARCHQQTRDYIARRRSEGKTTREAIRCLKRYLARRVWHLLQPPHPDQDIPTHQFLDIEATEGAAETIVGRSSLQAVAIARWPRLSAPGSTRKWPSAQAFRPSVPLHEAASSLTGACNTSGASGAVAFAVLHSAWDFHRQGPDRPAGPRPARRPSALNARHDVDDRPRGEPSERAANDRHGDRWVPGGSGRTSAT